MAQTKTQIQALLAEVGISPLKRFGQNFLIDGNLLRRLVADAEIRPDDVVLEVGPGTGTLTGELLERAGHVVAAEIDRGLQALCLRQFGENPRFTLIAGDVLQRKSAVAPALLETLATRRDQLGGRIMLVANLPYQVASPLLIDLLYEPMAISPLCFTVQAEVGERIAAPSGGRTYGPLSILIQAMATIRQIARVPPQAFWPAPDVDSVMLRLDVRPDHPTGELCERFRTLVSACFQHRRKTLRANIKSLLNADQLKRVAADGRWDLDRRPEQLSVAEWLALAEFVSGSA